jgi:hypothetical protein
VAWYYGQILLLFSFTFPTPLLPTDEERGAEREPVPGSQAGTGWVAGCFGRLFISFSPVDLMDGWVGGFVGEA